MPDVRYFVERQKAHSNAWIIKFDDEEYGPYKSQSEAVRFAIDAAEKRNDHGEKAQVVIIEPTWTYDQDISRGSWRVGRRKPSIRERGLKCLPRFRPPGVEGVRCAFKRLNCRFELLTTAVPVARVSNTRNRGS